MPITVCHPAAAVPLRKIGLDFSALIVGSMMPDFEFFVRLTDGRLIAHTIPGIFLFCIPMGLITLFLFHKLIKFPLFSLLPHNHQIRLYPVAHRFRFFPLSRFLLILLSLGIGAITHIFLDSFTHYDGWMVQHLSFLKMSLITLPQGTVHLYFLLQYVISALCAGLLVYWYVKWYCSAKPEMNIEHHRFELKKRILIGFTILVFSCTGGVIFGLLSVAGLNLDSTSRTLITTTMTIKTFISHSSIAMVTSFMVALIAFGILWHYFIPNHKRIRILHQHNKKEELPASSSAESSEVA